ncbi:MAG TPA: family 20 glycosylhydrolase [Cytophagales bacterium]|nr:family 20 glycosylhydrolase [Cytophagales bacterium]
MQSKTNLLLLLYFFLFSSFNCKSQTNPSAKDLEVKWKIIENNLKNNRGFLSQFTIINNGNSTLSSGNWNIYFNFPRMVDSQSVTGKVGIMHLNGDFFKLTPKEDFKLTAGDSIIIDFVSGAWALNQSDAPAGLYIVFNDSAGKEMQPEIISNYSVGPYPWEVLSFRFSKDKPGFITNEGTFNKYAKLTHLPEGKLQPLIPTPVTYQYGKQKVIIDDSYRIIANEELKEEKLFLANALNDLLKKPLAEEGENYIELLIGDISYGGKTLSKGDEAYELTVKPGKIHIKGSDKDGVFYGIQSLKALIPVAALTTKNDKIPLKEITITDFPGFHYRGIHLDVARNFQSKESVLQLLDLAAFYKLNKFHFHITDDEGWRLEIPSLPELTKVGSKRGHSSNPDNVLPSFGSGPSEDTEASSGSGFYSRKDFIEILKYAKERHIEVIPELDLPGHARAAIKSMDARYARLMKEGKPDEAKKYLLRDLQDKSDYLSVQMWTDNVVCVCEPSVYNFIETVVQDMIDMYKEADAPLTTIHTGGDEVPLGVWEKSPSCQKLIDTDPLVENHGQLWDYYLTNYDKVLDKYNLKTAGWEEIALTKSKTENGETVHVPNPKFTDAGFIPYVWNNINGAEDLAYKLANAGYPVVLSAVTNLYFDMAYNPNPEEIGYYWGGNVDTRKTYEFVPLNVFYSMFENRGEPIDQQKLMERKESLTEKGKENIIGIQGQLWSENVTSIERQQYFIFPKLLAFSEVAWVKTPSWANAKKQPERLQKLDSAYNVFANTLGQRELVRLDAIGEGINYRISPPGAAIEKGILKANVEFPGFAIRYTTDGTEPTLSSTQYKNPVSVKGTVKLKVFNSNGRGSRTIVVKE